VWLSKESTAYQLHQKALAAKSAEGKGVVRQAFLLVLKHQVVAIEP
jgi:hypothetical protein